MPRLHDWRLPVVVLAALAAALLAAGPLPWLLFYFSAGLLLLAYCWAFGLSRRLDLVFLDESRKIARGDIFEARLRLENDSFWPVTWLQVDDESPTVLLKNQERQLGASLRPLGHRTVALNYQAARRGYYQLGPYLLESGDPFAVFSVKKQRHSQATITVYPRVYPLGELPLPMTQPFGALRTRQRAFEDPSSLAELRPYRPGDNPKHIHWRSSARLGHLTIRQFELTATTELSLLLDLSTNGEALETAIEVAASLADLAVRRRLEFSLAAHGQERLNLPPATGPRALLECLERLARAEAGQVPLTRVIEREFAKVDAAIVITPHLTPELAGQLALLGNRRRASLVLVRAETFDPGAILHPQRDELLAHLSQRGINVYVVAKGDDLSHLAELRYRGVMAWAKPS